MLWLWQVEKKTAKIASSFGLWCNQEKDSVKKTNMSPTIHQLKDQTEKLSQRNPKPADLYRKDRNYLPKGNKLAVLKGAGSGRSKMSWCY